MEPLIVRVVSFVILSALSFFLIRPVILNTMNIRGHNLSNMIYKLCCSILIFGFSISLGDIVWNFGNITFYITTGVSWTAAIYCIYYWQQEISHWNDKQNMI